MAFRILKEEELSLLTGQQREQYERELDIYQKRAAFVEQIERYESTEIKPFRPKLDFTAPPGTPDIAPYHQREYQVKLQEPAAKPEVQLRFHKMDVDLKPEMPAVSVAAAASRELRKIENPEPILPVVPKPSEIDLPIREFDEVHAELPETRQERLSAPRQIRMENLSAHISVTAPKPPKMAALPENLPSDFRKSAVGLPDVDVPPAVFPDVRIPAEQRELKLPEVPAELKVRTPEPAGMPEINLSALPAVQKPRIREIKGFGEIKIQPQKTPAIHVPEAKSVSFIQPDVRPEGLPVIGKASVTARNFHAPQIHVRPLERTEVKAPVLNPLQPVRVKKTEPPEVKSVTVRQIRFPAVHVELPPRAAVEMPDVRAGLEIPDVRTVLKGLFNKNTEKEQ